MKLKIEYLNKEDLKPYANNAKIHTGEQIEQIKKSIEEFGFNDPIAIWHDNEIIEGHGRLLAVMEMDDVENVPVIRLDDFTDEQRKAYTLVHNKLTMNTDFDVDILNLELDDIIDIDMSQFGFEIDIPDEINIDENIENRYTSKVDIPQYEPSGENVTLKECLDKDKYENLICEIKRSNVTEEEKTFLIMAAARHLQFSYKKIADYYASKANEEMQRLMEQSALVIIDYNDAIKNGYAILRKTVTDLMQEDGYEA